MRGIGRGRGRVAPARNEAQAENVPREEALLTPQDEVEENVEIEVEDEDARVGTAGLSPLDLAIAQQILTFLSGLVGYGDIPMVQAAQTPVIHPRCFYSP